MSGWVFDRRRALAMMGMGVLAAGWTASEGSRLTRPFSDQRSTLHYIHPDHIVGDAHAFFYDGTCYLFYLGPSFQSLLVTSRDLLHWEDMPISHRHADDPDLAPYYVVFVFRDEAAHLFRTYHGWSGNDMICQVSDDLTHWDYAPPSDRVPAQVTLYSQQRDPFVFWNDQEGQYWCIMTCKVRGLGDGQNGAVGFASSPDLQDWLGRGHLFFPMEIREPEVPQMFHIGDKWYLLMSILGTQAFGKPSYRVSDACTGPWSAMLPDSLDGANLNAASTGHDGSRRLMFGWIPLTTVESHGYLTWGGHLAFPREVYQLPDGELGVRLESGIAQQIRGERLLIGESGSISEKMGRWSIGDTIVYDSADGTGQAVLSGSSTALDRLDIDVQLMPGEGNIHAGILLESPDGGQGTEIILDNATGHLRIRAKSGTGSFAIFSELALPPTQAPRQFRIIAEEDMVELFVDDRYALAARTGYRLTGSDPHVSLIGRGGPATFGGVNVYRLKTLNEIGES